MTSVDTLQSLAIVLVGFALAIFIAAQTWWKR
jgi:hypothetical protein